ncbi:hypothetical protein [Bordetella bronchialis]|uniref:Uncharacterized protein n=1 Tax=Bordetella bronchialis TaxID=463025 RepID=A0A193FWK2_9BORD|nr:hypothetical protein [Bordetella bronchialis]ANN67060.1 hypothetical protein BAU06_12845 [Bordetella bronchialis]ANN72137.1 hypothetical protein BAU08_13040 [Bordetella bronchialis]
MESTTLHSGASPASVGKRESFGSAVSWGAVLAGAFVAAATYLMLLLAGAGLGFASMSPWGDEGASAKTLGIGVIVWLVVIQIISAGLGGYIAGRMRTKWVDVHSDEVFFRDTAHGFLVWAVAAVVSAFLMGSGVTSALSGVARVGAGAASGAGSAVSSAVSQAAEGGGAGQPAQYYVDTLFRSDRPDATQGDAAKAEVGRIVAESLRRGSITSEDKTYVARVISAQTGVDQPTAEKRIDDTINRARQAADEAKQKAREAADQARKAAVGFALWAFISMLIGAFSSTYAATRGGRSRDAVL